MFALNDTGVLPASTGTLLSFSQVARVDWMRKLGITRQAWCIALLACCQSAIGSEIWTVQEGSTAVAFRQDALADHGVSVAVSHASRLDFEAAQTLLPITSRSTLTLTVEDRILTGFGEGEAVHDGTVYFTSSVGEVVLDGFTIRAVWEKDTYLLVITAAGDADAEPLMLLYDVKMAYDGAGDQLMVEAGSLVATQALAERLGAPGLVGETIGELAMNSTVAWTGGSEPGMSLAPLAPQDDDGALRGVPCTGAVGADVIVGVLIGTSNTTAEQFGGTGPFYDAFGIGTTSCNVGDAELLWISSTNQHPVIGQNFYKLHNGRYVQLGQSWLKHGFTALQQNACTCGCVSSGTGSRLGIGCSDPYGSGLNFGQSSAGPKWQVNAHTGFFVYPPAGPSFSGNTARRMHIPVDELIASNQPNAPLYFGEGHYVTPDDAAAGNQNNNASYIAVTVTGSGNDYSFTLSGATQRGEAGIRAWQDSDASVDEVDLQVPGEGLFIAAAKAIDLGGGFHRYEYAVQNLNSDRSAKSFSIPLPSGVAVQNVGFRDIHYWDGDGINSVNFDGTDWVPTIIPGGSVTWNMVDLAGDNDNALRWGTMYNFWFETDSEPGDVTLTLGLYKAGSPASVSGTILGPDGPPPVCGDGLAEGGEECDPPGNGCDANCLWICGDGVAHPPTEPCDSNGVNTAGCDSDCTLPACGDGLTNTAAGEACDDGGESATCDANCTLVSCGDGTLNETAGEECDPPNGVDCDANCNRIASCGDGVIDAGEQCDDGNTTSGDGCSATCQSESNDACANAFPVCPGNYNGSTATATVDGSASCGSSSSTRDVWYRYTATANGTLTAETCSAASYDTVVSIHSGCPGTTGNQLACNDDTTGCGGNNRSSRVSTSVVAGNSYLIRVSGWNGNFGTFTLTVTGPACASICGNGVSEPGEQCDDGDADNTDACLDTCQNATCGDGFLWAGVEECDDGNTTDGDGCSATCRTEAEPVCGNGDVEAGEACDDGNTTSGDGCSATCQFEVSGDECETCFPGGEGTFNGSTADASGTGNDTSCAGANDLIDEWYCYTASCTGQAVATTCSANTTFDTSLAAFDACGGTEIICNDDTPGQLAACLLEGTTNYYKSTIGWSVTSGTTYYVRVSGFGGATGNYELNISCTPVCGNGTIDAGEQCDDGGESVDCDADCTFADCGDGQINAAAGEECDDGNTNPGDGCSSTCTLENAPGNDNCANVEVVCPGLYGGNLSMATNDGTATCGSSSLARDVWYSYTPDLPGTLTIRTCGTHDLGGVDAGMDTVVSVRSACPDGSGSNADEITCNDDWSTGQPAGSCTGLDTGLIRDSSLQVAVSAGVTYIIRVSGFNNSAGEFVMQIDGPPCDSFTDCNENGRDDDDDIACGGGVYCDDVLGSDDCNANGIPDECDLATGSSIDCDGGPLGDYAAGAARVMALCMFCHGPTGDATNCPGGVCPGVNIRNYSRADIWDRLGEGGGHPGGEHPEYTQQDYADLEAFLADGGSRGRPDLVPDECQSLADCNENAQTDGCELEGGTQVDLDYNGVPDDCETGACCDAGSCTEVPAYACVGYVCDVTAISGATCFGDADGNGVVNAADRGSVSANLGQTDFDLVCLYDLDGNGVINSADRGQVSANLGSCAALPDYQNGSACNGGACPDPRFPAGDFRGVGTSCPGACD
jgi:cysteine-rich repeat protein